MGASVADPAQAAAGLPVCLPCRAPSRDFARMMTAATKPVFRPRLADAPVPCPPPLPPHPSLPLRALPLPLIAAIPLRCRGGRRSALSFVPAIRFYAGYLTNCDRGGGIRSASDPACCSIHPRIVCRRRLRPAALPREPELCRSGKARPPRRTSLLLPAAAEPLPPAPCPRPRPTTPAPSVRSMSPCPRHVHPPGRALATAVVVAAVVLGSTKLSDPSKLPGADICHPPRASPHSLFVRGAAGERPWPITALPAGATAACRAVRAGRTRALHAGRGRRRQRRKGGRPPCRYTSAGAGAPSAGAGSVPVRFPWRSFLSPPPPPPQLHLAQGAHTRTCVKPGLAGSR